MVEEANRRYLSTTAGGSRHNVFMSRSALLDVDGQKVTLRILQMDGCTMLFVCHPELECVNELGVSFPPKVFGGTEIAASTTLLGSEFASKSQRLAEHLSRRFGRQFFVSYNITEDSITGTLLEQRICDYVQNFET